MPKFVPTLVTGLAMATALSAVPAHAGQTAGQVPAGQSAADADARAAATLAAMRVPERTVLTHGMMPIPFAGHTQIPADAVPGAGYIAGISRLSVPALKESDASLGVAYIGGARKDGATALPSAMAMAATWNPALLRQGGAMIAAEAAAKGFNVLLAGGVNLMRDPRGGRTFEYLGEDPLLAGTLVGAAIAGIQSQHVISTIKHFALNGQETGRHFVNSQISDAAARESDLLAFEIGIEQGQPGAVMCAYNKVNGAQACDSDWLLNTVLKRDWGFKGFVMSDWGAVPSLDTALHGLDQQSGAELDSHVFFAAPLADAAAGNAAYATRLADMNRRILRSIYATGLDRYPPQIHPIDFATDGMVAQRTAEQAIVLLRNRDNALPLARTTKTIAVIGGYADSGVLSGGGSSQVEGEGGPAILVPQGDNGPFSSIFSEAYQRSVPLKAIKALAPDAQVIYRTSNYIAQAVAAARQADVAIVLATQWQTEGYDVPDLSLPHGQDALIAAVAQANPHTIVVLETGGPVMMPWLNQTAAVVEAWYPGARGAEAIANVLFGVVNPSGRLPATFPASLDQLPRPKLDGSDTVEPNFMGLGKPGQTLTANYDIEGSDVGYRWFAKTAKTPLFPFGFGLGYTRFTLSGLTLNGGNSLTASFSVSNTGARAGADVAQVYLTQAAGTAHQRLAGFAKVELAPGETRQVTVAIDPRILGDFTGGTWHVRAGEYQFALGESAGQLQEKASVHLAARTIKP